MSASKHTPRLQRYEMVDAGGPYSEYRQLEKCEPYPGQVPDERDEWCNAEDVAPLEDKNDALVQALYNFVCAASTNGALQGLSWELEQAREALVAARGFEKEASK